MSYLFLAMSQGLWEFHIIKYLNYEQPTCNHPENIHVGLPPWGWSSSGQEVVSDFPCTLPAVTTEMRLQVLVKMAQSPLPHPEDFPASQAGQGTQTPNTLLLLTFIGVSSSP